MADDDFDAIEEELREGTTPAKPTRPTKAQVQAKRGWRPSLPPVPSDSSLAPAAVAIRVTPVGEVFTLPAEPEVPKSPELEAVRERARVFLERVRAVAEEFGDFEGKQVRNNQGLSEFLRGWLGSTSFLLNRAVGHIETALGGKVKTTAPGEKSRS